MKDQRKIGPEVKYYATPLVSDNNSNVDFPTSTMSADTTPSSHRTKRTYNKQNVYTSKQIKENNTRIMLI